MKYLLIALVVAFPVATTTASIVSQSPGPTKPQEEAAKREPWLVAEQRVASSGARTAFPRIAASLSLTRTLEFSRKGEGIDTALQYRSADGKILGTVYAYLPGLSHAGLAAYATDQGIRSNSKSTVRVARQGLVAAGGVEKAAILTEYQNYMDGNFSSAALIKVGRWTIKVRVTAPEGRSAEAVEAMDTLLKGIEFGEAHSPFPPEPLAINDCAIDSGRKPARSLPDPVGADLVAHSFVATFDGGGLAAKDEKGERTYLPSRLPAEFCVSSRTRLGGGDLPILRSADGPALSISGRTRLVAVISDAGHWLEVVHAPNLKRFVVLYHNIGMTAMLGSYDAVPSDAQIADLLAQPKSEAGRIRVPVTFRSDGSTEIHLPEVGAERPSARTIS